MIPTYCPVVNVFGAYSLMKYGRSRMVAEKLPASPACQR